MGHATDNEAMSDFGYDESVFGRKSQRSADLLFCLFALRHYCSVSISYLQKDYCSVGNLHEEVSSGTYPEISVCLLFLGG